MKKLTIFLTVLLSITFLTIQESSAQDEKTIKFIIGEQEFLAVLYDTPAANALYERLPLTLTFEDFNGIEKIAYMDTKLPTEGEKMEFDPNVGDLCLYAPWGNLSLFYKDFRNSQGLVSLGRLKTEIDFFARQQNDFTVRIERVE
jgi:hypothetical protein